MIKMKMKMYKNLIDKVKINFNKIKINKLSKFIKVRGKYKVAF